MKLFYLVGAILVAVLILVISFAQLGATCTWFLFNGSTPPILVLLQMSFLGMITGGLLVLFWKAGDSTDDEGGDNE